MQVILLQRIEKLGQMGDVVTVKAGYGRNYLLPQKKALRATKNNVAFFEGQKVELEAANLTRRQEAEAVAKNFEGIKVNLIRQASENGQLYGSIRPVDIVEALAEQKIKVGRSQVDIKTPIKNAGIHEIRIVLHPEVTVSININIAASIEGLTKQHAEANKKELTAEDVFPEAAPQEGASDDAPKGKAVKAKKAAKKDQEDTSEEADLS